MTTDLYKMTSYAIGTFLLLGLFIEATLLRLAGPDYPGYQGFGLLVGVGLSAATIIGVITIHSIHNGDDPQ